MYFIVLNGIEWSELQIKGFFVHTEKKITVHIYSQLTINSTSDVTFNCNKLLAVRVKFFVSVHLAPCMIRVVVLTAISDTNNFEPSYQDAFDKGLLEISLVRLTTLLSLTTRAPFHAIEGLSASQKIRKFQYYGNNVLTLFVLRVFYDLVWHNIC